MIHVLCPGCGQWDVITPGHPATRFSAETGRHEVFDRSAVLPGCGCPEDGEGGRPLRWTFMAGVSMTGAGA